VPSLRRPRIGRSRVLEPAAVSFDAVIGVAFDMVSCGESQFVEHAGTDRRGVSNDLDGSVSAVVIWTVEFRD
jgi:hypothetical protein